MRDRLCRQERRRDERHRRHERRRWHEPRRHRRTRPVGAIDGCRRRDRLGWSPAPSDAAKVGGAAFTLVKNWNFGSNGSVRDVAGLSSEFQYHDQFGTIGNGSN